MKTLLMVLFACFCAPVMADDRPDIVLLIADDLGWGDVSCLDGAFPTPAIDQLAREGAVLNQFYSGAATCTPSRFTLFTGRYPWRSTGGLDRVLMFFNEGDRKKGLRANEITVAERLSAVGYDTMLAGKWHLGHGEDACSPTHHGFDRFHGCRGGCIDYFTHAYGHIFDWWVDDEATVEDGEATDLIARAAVEFIEAHDRTSGDSDPMFLVVCFTSPHYGKSVLEDVEDDSRTLVTRSAGKKRVDGEGRSVQPVNSLQATAADLEAVGVAAEADPELAGRVVAGTEQMPIELRRGYYNAMLKALDDGVADVLAALARSGREDAVVLFTADNGPDETVSNAGDSGRFKGAKATLHEGGIRVPTILRWPKVVSPGSQRAQVGGFVDILPTLCGIAGAEVPPETKLDGMDLGESWREGTVSSRVIRFRQGGKEAIRDGDWKLVQGRLYNLADDPAEAHDVAEQHADVVARMKALSQADQ